MNAAAIAVKTSRGIISSKAILVLSLVSPYLVDWVSAEEFRQFIIYAPIWIALDSRWSSYIGPTLMSLLMFIYWVPYVYVGYQSYRYANGKYSGVRRYAAGVALVTLLAVLLTVPLAMVPRASMGGTDYYSTVIPLPIVSILALVLIPLLRPVAVSSPWKEENSSRHTNEDIS